MRDALWSQTCSLLEVSMLDRRLMAALPVPALAFALSFAITAPAHADFDSCVAGIRASALSQGVSASVFDRAMAGVTPDPKVIEAMNNQPEFRTPIWDYLGALVDEERVQEGRQMLRTHAAALASAEARYGVDRHTIVAVWGVESNYGKVRGRWSLPQALSTAACMASRRREFFRGELIATMKIIQRGDLRQEQLMGSWAGAFGHTQFIPTTYLRLAVDGDGDGRRDLVDSIPDALHSTANFMAKAGFQTGASWGYEVDVPSGYAGPVGRTARAPVSSWAATPGWSIRRVADRPGSCSRTTMPLSPTMARTATLWRSRSSRIACGAAPACSRPGRPMIRRLRARSAASCSGC
jgi:lytic murein transglycosylase